MFFAMMFPFRYKDIDNLIYLPSFSSLFPTYYSIFPMKKAPKAILHNFWSLEKVYFIQWLTIRIWTAQHIILASR